MTVQVELNVLAEQKEIEYPSLRTHKTLKLIALFTSRGACTILYSLEDGHTFGMVYHEDCYIPFYAEDFMLYKGKLSLYNAPSE